MPLHTKDARLEGRVRMEKAPAATTLEPSLMTFQPHISLWRSCRFQLDLLQTRIMRKLRNSKGFFDLLLLFDFFCISCYSFGKKLCTALYIATLVCCRVLHFWV